MIPSHLRDGIRDRKELLCKLGEGITRFMLKEEVKRSDRRNPDEGAFLIYGSGDYSIWKGKQVCRQVQSVSNVCASIGMYP
jgi:hypothetical protein